MIAADVTLTVYAKDEVEVRRLINILTHGIDRQFHFDEQIDSHKIVVVDADYSPEG